ncbi:MAG: hypothetical protein RMK18_08285 [Armatimonadota bacterium]|nr:hypothetical protein [Armatimonadota bacterium]MCX7777847.1 hypothetical protein [Armatimonadota bacterium]MDW8025839.1 hypothetical protein [Armatimonadota bacterium]
MTRRDLLKSIKNLAVFGLGWCVSQEAKGGEAKMKETKCEVAKEVAIYRVTKGPKHHFFGYYDKTPWDKTENYLLSLETDFMDRPPTAEDVATILLIDLKNGKNMAIAETKAWNWQQGCMLQWMPNAPDRLVIYNDRYGDRFVSRILDIKTGEKYTLPCPIYALTRDGRFAVTLSFSRLHHCYPGYGYSGIPDPWENDPHPEKDGIYLMNIKTGEFKLIISIAQIARLNPKESMRSAKHWFVHLLVNHDNTRFIFLHRWSPEGKKGFLTRMFTANLDGTDIYCVSDHDMVSHFDWKDSKRILAWARRYGIGDKYFIFTDKEGHFEVLGDGILTADGHCSFSPDGDWILTDTYPDKKNMRNLILFKVSENIRRDIGMFFSPPELVGEIRCDLHPRWSPSGNQICIDSAHEGSRQMYVIDVSAIVR